MDRQSIRMGSSTLTRGTTQVGPRHDPYHREYVRCTEDGRIKWLLIHCSLAGVQLHVGGFEHPKLIIEGDDEVEAEFAKIAGGVSARYVLDKLFGVYDAHKYRAMTPDERMFFEEMQAIDAALQSYAM